MESRFRFIVVGCLQRLGSAAACVRCHSLISLDDGGARGAAADFLLFYSSRRVLHDSTRFLMPEDAYKNRAGHRACAFGFRMRWAITRSTGRLDTS